jgi:predicted transcriptional regulator
MNKDKDSKIADTELSVMKAVWNHLPPVSSSDILKVLKEQTGWKETTIYTLISRLVDKGFLLQEKRKNVSSYVPAISEAEYTLQQTQGFIDKLFGGDAHQLVAMLFQHKKIDAEDMTKLRDYWEDKNGAD